MDGVLILLLQIQLMKHSAKDAVAPEQLAPAVYKLATEYEVDPELVVQIIIVESRGRAAAYNAKTHDYGLMQINSNTAWLYGFSKQCLLNWRCNLEAGIQILADLQEHRHYRHCMYNVGPKWDKKERACKVYEAKLASIKAEGAYARK